MWRRALGETAELLQIPAAVVADDGMDASAEQEEAWSPVGKMASTASSLLWPGAVDAVRSLQSSARGHGASVRTLPAATVTRSEERRTMRGALLGVLQRCSPAPAAPDTLEQRLEHPDSIPHGQVSGAAPAVPRPCLLLIHT